MSFIAGIAGPLATRATASMTVNAKIATFTWVAIPGRPGFADLKKPGISKVSSTCGRWRVKRYAHAAAAAGAATRAQYQGLGISPGEPSGAAVRISNSGQVACWIIDRL